MQAEQQIQYPDYYLFWPSHTDTPVKIEPQNLEQALKLVGKTYNSDTEIQFRSASELCSYKRFEWLLDDKTLGYSNILPMQNALLLEEDGEHAAFTFLADVPIHYVAAVASHPHTGDLWSINGKPCVYVHALGESSISFITQFEQIEPGIYVPKMDSVEQLTDQEYIDYLAKLPFMDGVPSEDIQIVRTTIEFAE